MSEAGLQSSILLVDDHADTLSVLRRLLARRGAAVAVRAASDFEAAVAESGRAAVGLLLTDVGLGERDGCQLLAEVRAMYPRVRSIVLTGYGMPDEVLRTRAAGFDAVLIKPVDFEQLIRAVRQFTAHAAAEHGEADT